jgi:hypothetical protein
VGSKITGTGFVLMRMLGAVLRDDRGVSPHQLVSRVVLIRIHRVSGLIISFGILFERFCCPFRWSQPRRCRRCILYYYSGRYGHVLFIYYYFIYSKTFIFIHLAFCTRVLSCVRGEVVTPNPIHLFWGMT